MRQRGGIVLDAIIALAIAGALGTVALGVRSAWHGFTGQYVEQGKQAQLTADQAKLDASEKRATDAERAMHDTVAANQSLQGDVGRIQEDGEKCSKEVKDWKKLADQALNTAHKSDAIATAAVGTLNADRQKNLDRGHLPPSANASCQQILTAIDEDSADLAKKRAMLFPPELAPDRLKVGPAGGK